MIRALWHRLRGHEVTTQSIDWSPVVRVFMATRWNCQTCANRPNVALWSWTNRPGWQRRFLQKGADW